MKSFALLGRRKRSRAFSQQRRKEAVKFGEDETRTDHAGLLKRIVGRGLEGDEKPSVLLMHPKMKSDLGNSEIEGEKSGCGWGQGEDETVAMGLEWIGALGG
ncbi:UNVERIFIED_CONTAM: hypothetical protein PYX00_000036 [Menopon gallinae]|uniref:Uncharacterized protein n=1 Tax=Menopon gallinae TaxID=328185 RepID=A0AAW2I6X8_9NEOP